MTAKKKLTDQIAADIKRIAKKLGINPAVMTKAKYFSEDPKFSEWDIRKSGGYIGIRNAYFEQEDDGRDEASYTEVADIRKAFRKMRRDAGSIDLMFNRITEAVRLMPKFKAKPYRAKSLPAGKRKEPRTLNLILSDLHFGSDLTEDQHGHAYGKIEEARALATVVKNVCNYKLEYRNQTELVVNILGDIIENELHGASSTDYIHLQCCRAMWLLSQAVARFSENFYKVRVNFAVGNHGRDTSIHPKRATDVKFNALETTIYYGVKLACKDLSNVEFNQPKTPWVTYKAQGHNMYATHGDTNLNPGNPGNKLDIRGLEGQINKINASLSDAEEYEVFMCGHVHHALATPMPNGTHLITNGALVPPNSFAQSLNIMESQQIQVVFETTPNFAVGDFRFINVTASNSTKDKSLDSIIEPFKGLDYI